MKHSDGKTFTVTGTDDGLMKEINGSIPIDGNAQTEEPAPGVVDVNLVGTTWKCVKNRTMEDGSKVEQINIATFPSDSTFRVVCTIKDEVVSDLTGTYTVNGTMVNCI